MARTILSAALIALSITPSLASETVLAMVEDTSRLTAAPAAPQAQAEPATSEETPQNAANIPVPAPRPTALAASPTATPAAPAPLSATLGPAATAPATARADISALIEHHARLNNVPVDLVHRVVRRESNYNPSARGAGGVLGLMQIKLATARGVGYRGDAAGLMDANENLTWGVRYLAGAYRVAGGNHDRAVSYYASGYYYAAKAKGMLGTIRRQGVTTASAD